MAIRHHEGAQPSLNLEFIASNAPLFVNDHELRRRLAPHMGWESFRAAIRQCEKNGFPEQSALWRARYWPAVKLWLDRENGIGSNELVAEAQDRPENFDVPTWYHTRPQARPKQPSLLDRPAGRAGHDGLS